jgi:hypothetical protein
LCVLVVFVAKNPHLREYASEYMIGSERRVDLSNH